MNNLQDLPWGAHTPTTELQQLCQQLQTDYDAKLWHQLTINLEKFFQSDETKSVKLPFYNKFILPIIDKLNEISVVRFLTLSLVHVEADVALRELDGLKTEFIKIDSQKTRNDGLKDHTEACALIDLERANILLKENQLVVAKDILNKFEIQFINVNYSPLSEVTSTFYNVNALYFKLKNDYNAFHYNSLLYLSSLDPKVTAVTLDLTIDLLVAAILGDKIFNFGELLNNEKLTETIKANQDSIVLQWIISLLNCLTCGDFDKFSDLITQIPQENVPYNDKIELIVSHETFLRQKLCIMTLIEIVFTKNIRILSFNDVTNATHLNESDVEHLVMKAISLGLLQGSIDQVNQLITVTWVQPRIINTDQIKKMSQRLIDWNIEVTKLAKKMEKRGKSIWV